MRTTPYTASPFRYIFLEACATFFPRWSNLLKFLPLVRARIVSGHLTESGQFFEKCKFQFFTASPLKMRACGTGRKFPEYDQRVLRRVALVLANASALGRSINPGEITKSGSSFTTYEYAE